MNQDKHLLEQEAFDLEKELKRARLATRSGSASDKAAALERSLDIQERLRDVNARINMIDAEEKALAAAARKEAARLKAAEAAARKEAAAEKRAAEQAAIAEKMAKEKEVAAAKKKADAEAAKKEKARLKEEAKRQMAIVKAEAAANKMGKRAERMQCLTDGEATRYLSSKYVYVGQRAQYYCVKTETWFSQQGFDTVEAHNMPADQYGNLLQPSTVYKASPKCVKVVSEKYTPGREELVIDTPDAKYLNVWRAPELQPEVGDAAPMLQHIAYLCNGNVNHANHMLDWLAYIYQNPGKKVKHAILLISEAHGVGKDTLKDAMVRLMGQSNVAEVSEEILSGGFNSYMVNKCLVVVPETICDDRNNLSNKMKPFITSDKVMVNEKMVPAREIDNTVNFMMFSNFLNAAKVEEGDRRLFVIICEQAPMPEDYYRHLHSYIQGDGLKGFAWYLQNHDLSHFNPNAPAPATVYKDLVRQHTKSSVDQVLEDMYEAQDNPFDMAVVRSAVMTDLIHKNREIRVTASKVEAFLRRRNGGMKKVRIGDKTINVIVTRDFDIIKEMSGAEIDDMMGQSYSKVEPLIRARRNRIKVVS